MSNTVILVEWFKFAYPMTNILIAVSEKIHTVYSTLQQEGVDVEVYKIVNTGDRIQVSIGEVNEDAEEAEEVTYDLIVNLLESKISFQRFNQIIDDWGFDKLIGDDEGDKITQCL